MQPRPAPESDEHALVAPGGHPLGALVREALGCPWSRARDLIHSGRVLVDGEPCAQEGHRPAAGARVVIRPRAPRHAEGTLAPNTVVLCDPQLLVVDKPAGLSTVPFDEKERDTLVDRAKRYLSRTQRAGHDPPLFVVHRIDKETSGLVVFARTWLAKRHLAGLFRRHALERSYLALCEGHLLVERATYDSVLLEDRGDGLRGSARSPRPGHGQRAITHVQRLAYLQGCTLLRCTLETGRTHQIRIHLSEAGHPLVGERVYVRGYGAPRVEAARMMLHAGALGFTHPVENKPEVRLTREPPEDFRSLALRLGARPEQLLLTL